MTLPRLDDPQPGLRLALGPGEGDRLVAPGVPDRLLADGVRLGWLSRGALVLLDPDRGSARLIVLDHEPDQVSTGPERWVFAHEGGLALFDPQAGQTHLVATDLVEELVDVRPGGRLAVLRTAGGNRVVDLDTGEDVPVPLGARRSPTLVPWSAGAGLLWIADDSLYRWHPGRGVAVCAQLPGRATALVPGPGGACLVTLAAGTCLGVAPGRQAAVLTDEVLAPTACFDAAGQRLLATCAEGVALLDLRTGERLQVWPGGVPVGFAPAPVRLDDARGVLLGPDDSVLLAHLGLAGVSVDTPLLVGPGGTAWDLSSGEPWADTPLSGGITATDDDRVLHVADREATLFDDRGSVQARWRVPLFPEAAAEGLLSAVRTGGGEDAEMIDEVVEAAFWDDVLILLTLDGQVGLVDPAGGELLRREAIEAYEETDGWPGLLPHRRRGVWLRDGEGARLLPRGPVVPDPGTPVEALVPVGRDLVRALGDRLERLDPASQPVWTTGLGAHLLAQGRHLYVADGADLVLVDAETGRERQRSPDALGDAEGLVATSDGHVWAWGGLEGEALVRCLDGATGAHRRSWALPADGVVVGWGAAWVWTDDGMLVRLQR